MRVTWVHPSWRDLVIDALARDPDERRRFLSCCGVDGAALALSGAGGAAGERRLPLLREDADWDALGDGLHHLCAELDEPDAVGLLGVLADVDRQAAESEALIALALARLGWAGHAVSVDALYAWAAAADRLGERPDPSAVAKTWLALEPAAGPRTPEELERFADWLRLTVLVADTHPTLLEEFGFPLRHAELLAAFVAQDPPEEPVLERELRLEALGRIAILDPELAARAVTAALALRVEAPPPMTFEVTREPRPATSFPVERVLRDLAD